MRSRRGAAIPTAVRDQRRHTVSYLVPNSSHHIDRLVFRIFERPILDAESWHVRAFIAATHRDQQGRAVCEFFGQPLRTFVTEVEPGFPHDLDDNGVDALSGLRARRHGCGSGRIRQRTKKGRRHLRTAGVVNAREDDAIHHGLPCPFANTT